MLTATPSVAIGAPTLFETALVLASGRGSRGALALSAFQRENELAVIPFDELHAATARDAFARYGKGRHPAALNYGDCMTYATAKLAAAPLLYVGEDFAKTDLASA